MKTSHRPPLRGLLLLALLGAALGTTVAATAQDRTGRAESDAPRVRDDGEEPEDPADVEASREVVEGAGKVKVIEFTGLDISGRLKSPQLLYFLNRLRAEFDRPRLPHRSFMPELQRATKSRSFE